MIGRVNLWISVGVLLAACLAASAAQAQVVFGPGAYGLGFFDYNHNQPRIPYYALYPPVYYSYPVARPYGFSPFAYPPGTMTPDAAPKAAEYRNPYVPERSKPQPTTDRTAATAKVYYNPYVQQASIAGK